MNHALKAHMSEDENLKTRNKNKKIRPSWRIIIRYCVDIFMIPNLFWLDFLDFVLFYFRFFFPKIHLTEEPFKRYSLFDFHRIVVARFLEVYPDCIFKYSFWQYLIWLTRSTFLYQKLWWRWVASEKGPYLPCMTICFV